MKKHLLKLLILLSTAYAMFRMFHWAIGFTMFTQLSNLYTAVAVIYQLVKPGRRSCLLKYPAAVSISITFLVYLLIIAPMTPGGILAAYRQDHWASFCMHVITPVLTVLDFMLNDSREGYLRKSDVFFSVIPPVAYFIFSIILSCLGMRWYGGMAAPYPFLNYAAPAGWFGFMPDTAGRTSLGIGVFYVMLVMLSLTLLIAWALLMPATHFRRSKLSVRP